MAGPLGREYTLTVDTAFDRVVESIQWHTYTSRPGDCWLSRELAQKLKSSGGFHTVELWHGDELIAANLGYTLGDVYSGLTKFYSRSHSGAGIMWHGGISGMPLLFEISDTLKND